ncbi:MAG TPA: hypothetical protein IGS17_14660 [Oscillatoriales cyanobacterium M59_W2019_021]|nr:MAG: hypothetical protein D6728_16305 [Cyanobacteria bacterium J055]HIK30636.1 hypothetical protein [Oscillatoriales cyanobacterium M4454_W2019_049]HIK52146.1 hypothetical protein [Oscillatoriales cyanobacterium M59_W2019_021]
MCFSASASFTASAFLVPTGIYCVREALNGDSLSSDWRKHEYLALACLPLFFGIQQGFEGILWLGLDAPNSIEITVSALGFLFFSHFFWLTWIPFSAFALEHHPQKKNALLGLTAIGALYGVFLYLPLLFNPDWLNVSITHGSIDYQVRLIFENFLRGQQVVWIYVFFILCPLFLSSIREINVLGSLIAISAFLSSWFFSHAFISVWCFFAALISAYVFYVLQKHNESISDEWMV